jgi:acetylornithine deacetylase/succinyl-diaminopimelate desuccinylase-like protein
MTFGRLAIMFASTASVVALAQGQKDPDWKALEAETMQHYQAVLRLDTRNPPGNEVVVAEYVKGVLEKEGIPAILVGTDRRRPNLIARLKGNGKKKPILIMGHSDTVTTDEKKWTHPPLSATRDGGYVYGRGTIDDKDNLTASLMTMLLLKRLNVPLDRDVIFVSEAGEEGGFSGGIGYLVKDHFPEIEAEYCLAEGGGVTRIGGQVKYATVQTLEKIPRGIELVAHGISGSGGPTSGSTRPPAPISASWRRSRRPTSPGTTATCSPAIPRSRRPPTTGCSKTSRGIPRCCAPRYRPTSSPAATART